MHPEKFSWYLHTVGPSKCLINSLNRKYFTVATVSRYSLNCSILLDYMNTKVVASFNHQVIIFKSWTPQ